MKRKIKLERVYILPVTTCPDFFFGRPRLSGEIEVTLRNISTSGVYLFEDGGFFTDCR